MSSKCETRRRLWSCWGICDIIDVLCMLTIYCANLLVSETGYDVV